MTYNEIVKEYEKTMGHITARQVTKKEIMKKYGSWDNYKAESRILLNKEKKRKQLDRQLDQLSYQYDLYKNKITDRATLAQYNTIYKIKLAQYRNTNKAKREALEEIKQKGLNLNDYTVEDILCKIGIANEDMDITDSEYFDSIIASIEQGATVTEAFKEAVELAELESEVDNTILSNLNAKEVEFMVALTDREKEFANRMKDLQPTMQWNYEKVYRMNYGDDEADKLLTRCVDDSCIAANKDNHDDNKYDDDDDSYDDDSYIDDDDSYYAD